MIPYDIAGVYDTVCEWRYLEPLQVKGNGCVEYAIEHDVVKRATIPERVRMEILARKV